MRPLNRLQSELTDHGRTLEALEALLMIGGFESHEVFAIDGFSAGETLGQRQLVALHALRTPVHREVRSGQWFLWVRAVGYCRCRTRSCCFDCGLITAYYVASA